MKGPRSAADDDLAIVGGAALIVFIVGMLGSMLV